MYRGDRRQPCGEADEAYRQVSDCDQRVATARPPPGRHMAARSHSRAARIHRNEMVAVSAVAVGAQYPPDQPAGFLPALRYKSFAAPAYGRDESMDSGYFRRRTRDDRGYVAAQAPSQYSRGARHEWRAAREPEHTANGKPPRTSRIPRNTERLNRITSWCSSCSP